MSEVISCPHCRGLKLRRRKREGFFLHLLSLVGRWPYSCESCGAQFFLRKRYVRVKSGEDTATLVE